MPNRARNFLDDESGAVTVDWVVLTAAVVVLPIVVLAGIRDATSSLSQDIGASLADAATFMTTAGSSD